MRTLASIVTIEKCWNLEGKDRVQGCSFVENSYEAMIGKDLKEGDLAVFIQEGAILPVEPRWEFLRKRCFREDLDGFLIKPQKFSSIKSWGLTLSLTDAGLEGYKAGDDVTSLLKIRKYEPREDASPVKEEKLWQDYLQHEGVVVRSMNYDKDSGIGCSFKVKNLEYQEKSLKSIFDVAYKLSLKTGA